MRQYSRIALLTVLLVGLTYASAALVTPTLQAAQPSLKDLPIGMDVYPPTLEYFNQVARPDDVGAVLITTSPQLLPQITSGQRMILSPSLELAKRQADSFLGNVEYLGYNIEHWPRTPDTEQRDPVAASRAAAEFAESLNLGYAIGPDLQFTEENGPGLARYADIYVIQGQRLQEDIPFFRRTVTEFAGLVRSDNPQVKVWVQVSTSFGTPEQTLSALKAVAGQIDGVWIHYNQNPQGFTSLQRIVELLRPASPPPLIATATPGSSVPGITPLATQQAVSPATPIPTPTVPPARPDPGLPTAPTTLPWLALIGGAMVLAVALLALGFVLGYLWRVARSN